MSRHFVFCVALAALAHVTACDRPNPDAAADNTKDKDGYVPALAEEQARRTGLGDPPRGGEIDGPTERTALAKSRDDYRSQMLADIDSFDGKVRDLEAKEKAASGKIKSDLDGALPLLRAQREAFLGDLRAIETATEVSWEATKARLDKELADLKGAADRAS